MAITILFICFISIFFCLGISTKATGKKELLISSVLVFSAILVIITESLSLLSRLNCLFVLISWLLITLYSIIHLYLNKEKVKLFSKSLKTGIKEKLFRLTKTDKLLLAASIIILLLIFIQGLLYPPNNFDSMTYHMARITSWVSHQSLSHYPTAITRQLYQPPFAEYVIMNFGILSRTDLFSNTVQFLFLLFSIVTVLSIVESFGLNRSYKIIAIVLCITIPEVILQAASTQNDIVTAFFIIAAFYFTIRSVKDRRLKNYVFIGLATGLGLLTKGTAFIYLPPVLLVFGIIIIIQLFKSKNYNIIWYSMIAIVIAVGLNAGHFSRNYKLTGNILGVDKAESKLYSNQKMNGGYLLSNIVKNAGLHTGVMFVKPAAVFSNQIIYKFHQIIGVDINDTATNYRNFKYSTITPITNEDSAPNPFHFLFIIIAVVLIIYHFFKGRQNILVTSLLLILIIQGLFFCFYLRWQPWHSRLQVPMFLISVPIICYCISVQPWSKRLFYIFSPIILVYALLVVLHNDRRPYTNAISENRYQKYFHGNPSLYREYNVVNNRLQKSNYQNIGLILGEDDWEYPLFTQSFSKKINPVYIEVNNFSKAASPDTNKVDCIISTTTNKPFIDFNEKRYMNKTVADKIIWMYE